VKETLIDYNDIFFEKVTLEMEIKSLNDDALLDECNHILSSGYESEAIEDILISYFKKGSITKEERKRIEEVYSLAYGNFTWEV
jgi:hypothetical protein